MLTLTIDAAIACILGAFTYGLSYVAEVAGGACAVAKSTTTTTTKFKFAAEIDESINSSWIHFSELQKKSPPPVSFPSCNHE